MQASRLFLCLALALGVLPASAQWQWIDQNGRKVFSDSAPPPDIPPKNILKQPAARVATPAAAAASSAAQPAAAASAPKLATKDPELEAKKKAADEAAAEKKRAQDQEVQKARAENCDRAKRYQATLESGVRIQQTNAKGEREFLGDEQRKAEVKRAADIAARDCGPPPSAKPTANASGQ